LGEAPTHGEHLWAEGKVEKQNNGKKEKVKKENEALRRFSKKTKTIDAKPINN